LGTNGGTTIVPNGAVLYNLTHLDDVEDIVDNITINSIVYNGLVQITLKNRDNYEVLAYSTDGKLVHQQKVDSSTHIHLHTQPNGVYIIQVNHIASCKGVVQRVIKVNQ
jgi:hypothetical protein